MEPVPPLAFAVPAVLPNRRQWIGLLIAAAVSAVMVVWLNRFLPLLDSESRWPAGFASWLIMWLTLLLCAYYPRVGCALLIGVVFFGALQRYIQSIGIQEPNVLITDLLETDPRELAGFIDITMITVIAAGTVASYLLVRLLATFVFVSGDSAWRRRRVGWGVAAVVGALAIGLLAVPKPKMEEAQERLLQAAGWPYIPLAQSLRIVSGYWSGEKQFAHLVDGLPPASAFPSAFEAQAEGLVVVFVFGESVRADHWGMNGYARDTTPRLRVDPNVINFPDTLSFGTYTQVSAIGMMTPASFGRPMPLAGSFVDLFVTHGFETAAFISSRPTSMQIRLIEPIKRRVRQRGLAELLLPELRSFFSRSPRNNQFAFIYTEGNHFPYFRDYPAEFSKFKPDDHGRVNLSTEVETLTNAYDNAVLYTDWFLAEIIDMLRTRRAIVIYASDHGDALGDEGNFIRGGTIESSYLRKVPFVIWVSDAFVRSDRDKVLHLREHAGLKVAHEHLFGTVLALAGIGSELVSPAMDLSSAQALPRDHEPQSGAPLNSPFHVKR